jgi:catechol 2,3-dioxygenase-like lactoylglutathione lyase family enzyme
MQLAKPAVDIGLNAVRLAPVLAFWQGEAGVPFDHLLRISPTQDQHRHSLPRGSVLKINHRAQPPPANPPAGYQALLIARPGVSSPLALTDPDGVRLELVPPGHEGVRQIGVRIAVRDLAAHRRFYAEALGLPEERPGAFRAGESLILLHEAPEASADAQMQGPGWRYITFQVFKVDEEHARVLAAGGREALAPVTLGTTARISMVRDPDGNWIELSQRASIVGSLG